MTRHNKPADSDVIIEKVDGIYKEFTVFQTNLKKLLALYKEEHSTMKTLNKKRFDVSASHCVDLFALLESSTGLIILFACRHFTSSFLISVV